MPPRCTAPSTTTRRTIARWSTPSTGLWSPQSGPATPRPHWWSSPSTASTPSRHSARCGSRQETANLRCSAEGAQPGQGLADDECVHLGGALIGENGLQVVGVPQHGVLQRDAVGTKDRAALPRDGDRLAGVVELAKTDLAWLELAGILEPPEVQSEQEALLELQSHVGQLLLGQLVAADRPIEHLTAARVVQGYLQTVTGCAQGAEDDTEARLVEA